MKLRIISCIFGMLTIFFQASASAQPTSRPQVLLIGLSEEQREHLRREFSQVEFLVGERDELVDLVAGADALIGSCSPELIKAAGKLRWVQVYSAGVSGCMFPEVVESDIVLTNAKIIQGPEIADHALALLLFLTRNLRQAVQNQSQEEWAREGFVSSIELRGKTALIIGLGGIGLQVAERAAAFGMRVLALDPQDMPYINFVEKVGKPDLLHEYLPQADAVFMCAPLTPQTEGMLSSEEFSLMKKGAYFVNVSRGKTVDTEALVEVLKSGWLAGAGLDVVEPEPLPTGHALWSLQNVILTPHVAGRSDQIAERRMNLVKENLERFVKGLPLRNVVYKRMRY